MATTIENPIINGPFEPPARHFRFDEDGITSEVVESRRKSAYFMPIARPKKKGAQKNLETARAEGRAVPEPRYRPAIYQAR